METVHKQELTKESRVLLAKTASKLDVQRAVTRLTKCPAAGMMIRQLLFFDDKKKVCEDYWIFKSGKQWEKDEGLTRSQVRTATRKIEEFGLAQVDTERCDPLYNNVTTFYRLDIYRVMQVVDPAKLERLEPELRYLEPDIDDFDVDDFDLDFLADGVEDFEDDAPLLTDEDAPDEEEEILDWWPEDLENTAEDKGVAGGADDQPLPPKSPTPPPDLTNRLVNLANPMYRVTTPEEVRQEKDCIETPTFSRQSSPSATLATQDSSKPQVRDETSPRSPDDSPLSSQRNEAGTTPCSPDDPLAGKDAGEVGEVSGSPPTSKPPFASVLEAHKAGASDAEIVALIRRRAFEKTIRKAVA